jgi:vitamin B12 transporter
VIDADETGRIEQKTAALSATHTARGGAWTNKFSYAFTDAERESRGDGEVTFSTDGRRDRFSWASAAAFSIGAAENRVTAAFDWKRETYLNVALAAPGPENERRRLHNRGLVLAYDAVWRNFAFGAAYRYDDNSRFRDAETYRLQASLGLGESGARIRGAYGTGIKNPTNFELFGFNPTRFIGNPALKPESSRGWDIGLEQIFLNERARLAVTYFKARLADEIFTAFLPGFVSTPQNRTSISPRQGIELSLDARLAPPLSLNGSFSWIDAEEAGERELRRPRVTAALGLTYRFIDERVSATLAMRYTGTQDDSEFVSTTPQTRARLDDFLLVNLSASFDLTPRVTLFGRIENLLDQSYEEIFSYRSPGRSAYAGTRLRF